MGQLAEQQPELRQRVRVHILGGVSPEIRARYDEILARYRIAECYDFAGDIPYHEAMRAQVQADYLLLIVDTGATSSGVIPGKLFEYVAARRPIFALTDPGATQEIIERGRLGTVVPAEDTERCREALAEWLTHPVPERLDADAVYLAQFDFEYVAARRPIFALTDPGATQEIIERGRLGTVVPAEDTDVCREHLKAWLDRPVPILLQRDEGYVCQFDRHRISRRLGKLLDTLT